MYRYMHSSLVTMGDQYPPMNLSQPEHKLTKTFLDTPKLMCLTLFFLN